MFQRILLALITHQALVIFEMVLGRQLRVLPMMINMEEILCLRAAVVLLVPFVMIMVTIIGVIQEEVVVPGKISSFFRGYLLKGGAGMLSPSLSVDDKSLYLGLGLKSRTLISLRVD